MSDISSQSTSRPDLITTQGSDTAAQSESLNLSEQADLDKNISSNPADLILGVHVDCVPLGDDGTLEEILVYTNNPSAARTSRNVREFVRSLHRVRDSPTSTRQPSGNPYKALVDDNQTSKSGFTAYWLNMEQLVHVGQNGLELIRPADLDFVPATNGSEESGTAEEGVDERGRRDMQAFLDDNFVDQQTDPLRREVVTPRYPWLQ